MLLSHTCTRTCMNGTLTKYFFSALIAVNLAINQTNLLEHIVRLELIYESVQQSGHVSPRSRWYRYFFNLVHFLFKTKIGQLSVTGLSNEKQSIESTNNCFVCLMWFFTSNQQCFSYIGTDHPGLN